MHTLPKLNFKTNDLEPFMDEQTVIIHHTKHHQTYLDKFLAAIKDHEELQKQDIKLTLKNLNKFSEPLKTQIQNFGGGFYNHNFFWSILNKKNSSKPSKELENAIIKKFSSFENFKKEFSDNSLKLFGSGWCWLVLNNKHELEIVQTKNQDCPISNNQVPILVIDLWEHAYYLKYQNKRNEFIESFFNILDWNTINKYFEEACQQK